MWEIEQLAVMGHMSNYDFKQINVIGLLLYQCIQKVKIITGLLLYLFVLRSESSIQIIVLELQSYILRHTWTSKYDTIGFSEQYNEHALTPFTCMSSVPCANVLSHPVNITPYIYKTQDEWDGIQQNYLFCSQQCIKFYRIFHL